jgi:hypothetical protein
MNDTFFVRRLQRLRDLFRDRQGLISRNRTTLDPLLQRLTRGTGAIYFELPTVATNVRKSAEKRGVSVDAVWSPSLPLGEGSAKCRVGVASLWKCCDHHPVLASQNCLPMPITPSYADFVALERVTNLT